MDNTLNYCLCTEATDKTFPYLRVMLRSFMENNPWFDGDIVVLIGNLTPFSEDNRRIVSSIYKNVKFKSIDNKPYHIVVNNATSKNKSNIVNHIHTMYAIDAMSLNQYDFVLYISHLSLITGDMSKLFSSDADLVSTIDSYDFPIGVSRPRKTDKQYPINTGIMLMSKNILNSNLSKDIKLKLCTMKSITQSTHSTLITEHIAKSEFKLKLMGNTLYAKKSSFPDAKSRMFNKYRDRILGIELDVGIFDKVQNITSRRFKHIDSIWMQYNVDTIEPYDKVSSTNETALNEYLNSINIRTISGDKKQPIMSNPKRRPGRISNALLRYITGKKICVVGPSANLEGMGMGKTIDSYDIVVRFNGSIPMPLEHQLDYGIRTDVLYINNFFIKKTGRPNIKHLSTHTKYIVSKMNLSGTIRILPGSALGSRLMGNIAICDLLAYKPAEIYITGIDFYQNTKNFKPNYHDPRYFGKNFNPTPGRAHNLEYNINDLRQLHSNNSEVIKLDETLNNILYEK